MLSGQQDFKDCSWLTVEWLSLMKLPASWAVAFYSKKKLAVFT